MSVERPCDVCGEPFRAQRPTARYCGPTCRQRAKSAGGVEKLQERRADIEAEVDGPDVHPDAVLVGVLAAAQSGDRLKTLEQLRDTLARQIDAAKDPFGLPALADKLVKVLTEIANLQPPERKGTPLDELQRRREAKGAPRAQSGAQRR